MFLKIVFIYFRESERGPAHEQGEGHREQGKGQADSLLIVD